MYKREEEREKDNKKWMGEREDFYEDKRYNRINFLFKIY